MNCFISILDFSRALRFSAARCKNREVLGFRKKFPHAKQCTEGVDEEKIKSSELAATYPAPEQVRCWTTRFVLRFRNTIMPARRSFSAGGGLARFHPSTRSFASVRGMLLCSALETTVPIFI